MRNWVALCKLTPNTLDARIRDPSPPFNLKDRPNEAASRDAHSANDGAERRIARHNVIAFEARWQRVQIVNQVHDSSDAFLNERTAYVLNEHERIAQVAQRRCCSFSERLFEV